jgi:hypothetical protein
MLTPGLVETNFALRARGGLIPLRVFYWVRLLAPPQ